MLEADGNIEMWPDAFFGEVDNDMNYFAAWSRYAPPAK